MQGRTCALPLDPFAGNEQRHARSIDCAYDLIEIAGYRRRAPDDGVNRLLTRERLYVLGKNDQSWSAPWVVDTLDRGSYRRCRVIGIRNDAGEYTERIENLRKIRRPAIPRGILKDGVVHERLRDRAGDTNEGGAIHESLGHAVASIENAGA
ncbi:MAG TPA: hypothetical protein VK550_10635 [Polyangiaceae bacterium]|nr:hypothetical protein [Polyangiaceae bacterium]